MRNQRVGDPETGELAGLRLGRGAFTDCRSSGADQHPKKKARSRASCTRVEVWNCMCRLQSEWPRSGHCVQGCERLIDSYFFTGSRIGLPGNTSFKTFESFTTIVPLTTT